MRTVEMIKAKVEAETEGLGFVLAALLEAKPADANELAQQLEFVRTAIRSAESPTHIHDAAYEVAESLLRGVNAYRGS